MTQAILYGSYPEVRYVAYRMEHYTLTRPPEPSAFQLPTRN